MKETVDPESGMRGFKSQVSGQIAKHSKPLGKDPTEIERWMNLLTVGCRMPKQMQRVMICQWIMMSVFLFVWVKFNGGQLLTFYSILMFFY